MSLELIHAEIRRFLSSSSPGVLCIKGSWGVGKTYAWKKYLQETHTSGDLAWSSYAYVSLFGLSALDDLKYAIFESTLSQANLGTTPDMETFHATANAAFDKARKWRGYADMVAGFFGKKDLATALYKSAFLSVRNRLVCFDDLERAGKGLEPRDVLGLASYLKEERRCGVVLLLNERQMNDEQLAEFERQLEKVADETLRFDLSAAEAVSIALTDTQSSLGSLGQRVIELGVNNIRVIKKMERLAQRLAVILANFDRRILERAVTAVALGSWSVQQPDLGPPLSYVRGYNELAADLITGTEPEEVKTAPWRETLENYSLSGVEEFELAVIDGAEAGYFDEARLIELATIAQAHLPANEGDDSFTLAWTDLYHGSLSVDDDEFLDRLHEAALENISHISLLNINSTIEMLRGQHRDAQADAIVQAFAARNEPLPFFNIGNQHFLRRNQIDPALAQALDERYATFEDARDPARVIRLIGVARSWTEADVVLLSKASAATFETAIAAISGPNLKPTVETLLSLARSYHGRYPSLQDNLYEALRNIAAKSPLRARRLQQWALDIPDLVAPAEAENPTEQVA